MVSAKGKAFHEIDAAISAAFKKVAGFDPGLNNPFGHGRGDLIRRKWQAVRMRRDGCKISEIVAKTGLNPRTVYSALDAAGLVSNHSLWLDVAADRARDR